MGEDWNDPWGIYADEEADMQEYEAQQAGLKTNGDSRFFTCVEACMKRLDHLENLGKFFLSLAGMTFPKAWVLDLGIGLHKHGLLENGEQVLSEFKRNSCTP